MHAHSLNCAAAQPARPAHRGGVLLRQRHTAGGSRAAGVLRPCATAQRKRSGTGDNSSSSVIGIPPSTAKSGVRISGIGVEAPPAPAASTSSGSTTQDVPGDKGTSSSSGGTPYRMNMRQFLEVGDGPPRIISLLNPAAAAAVPAAAPAPPTGREHLPLMLYLPGVDGTGLAASQQFPSLLQKFDMRTFVTPPKDRTPFVDLVAIVVDFLQQEVPTCSPTRPVYILGESFGGLLALAVAAEVPSLVDRLVLVNPATSFSKSLWPLIGPLLPQMPAELYRALPLALAPVLGNPINLLAGGFDSSPGVSMQQRASQLADTAVNLLSQLPVLADILPADTLAWKLELLQQGGQVVEPLLPLIQQRCFLLVGDADLLIPSREEGPRLQRALPRAELRVERGRSHALLQEGGVDLADILEQEGFYVRERRMSAPISKRVAARFGVAAPIELPTPAEVERYAERTTAFGRRLTSPVFISTSPEGRRSLGLSQIPAGRPLLLVGNHQTLALDLGVLGEQFLREQGVLLRGLAHPVIFAQSFNGSSSGSDGRDASSSSGGGDQASSSDAGTSSVSSSSSSSSGGDLPAWDPIPAFGSAFSGRGLEDTMRGLLGGSNSSGGSGKGSSSSSSSAGGGGSSTNGRSAFLDFMTTFGAVPVSAFNMHRLLQAGEAVLLFPGGVREAYKRRGEDYQLFWPEKSEFIRMAARFGATIVPFAAVGVDDSLNILADSQQLEDLPVFGDMLKRRAGGLPQARRGVSATSGEAESFVAPLAAPRLPPGRMYFLFQKPIQTSPEDLKDRERCDELYRCARESVESGLAYLLEQRKRDPYRDFLPRSLYEAAYRGRQAPTFPL